MTYMHMKQAQARSKTHTHTHIYISSTHRHGLRNYSHSSGKIDLDGFFNPSSHLTCSHSFASFALQHLVKAKNPPYKKTNKKTKTKNMSRAIWIRNLQTAMAWWQNRLVSWFSGFLIFGRHRVPTQGGPYLSLNILVFCGQWVSE